MHSFSCDLENFMILGHDFVLQRNIQIVMQNPRDKQTSFVSSTFGSHYLHLMDHIAKL